MRIVEPSVKLMAYTPDPEKLIERCGRTCYKSEDKITDDSHVQFIKSIMKREHMSVIEHASATFHIVTDRGISHEFVRHRPASYDQESSRYCCYASDKFGQEIAVVRPVDLPDSGREYAIWKFAMRVSQWAYLGLTRLGVRAEVARAVLPTCLKTELDVTANFREWLHILKLRTDKAAHSDMRVIANMIGKELYNIAPNIFEAYK